MALDTLAIDIGKHSFHVFGIDDDGVVVSHKISRAKLVATIDRFNPRVVAMEACGSAHHWGRLFQAAGRTVRLINAYFVKPFVRGSKNDATDAQAIFEAAGRPTMRFVPVKSVECQDLQALHRIRDRLVHSRTSLINHTRGLLAEYGVVLPQGARRFTAQVGQVVAEADLSDLARELFSELLDQLGDVDRRIEQIDARLVSICRENAACRRLMGMPGIGPVVATALLAAVNNGRQFGSGRDLAAWIGLVPRQYTTGGKPKLGGIGRRANHYLRRQIVHGARAVMSQAGRRSDPRAEWMKGVAARRGFNRAVIAVAALTPSFRSR
jgi:transposase